ncbi:MAG: hypothetical protein ABWY27_20240 [Telluria sp.]
MNDAFTKKLLSRFAFTALFASLFLLFTPFEQSGSSPSMAPKYYVAGMALMPLLPLMIIKKIRFHPPVAYVVVIVLTIIFHAALIDPIPPQFILLIITDVSMAIMIYEASFLWKKEFVAAVSLLVLINAVIISIQALMFHFVSHHIFDFHQLIFGSRSRFAEDFLNIARFTGMQVEPGTYANYVGCLLAILIYSADFNKKVFWITLFGIISIFVTNSGSAIYFAPVLMALAGYMWRAEIKRHHVILLALAVFCYLYFSSFLPHLESRFMERDDGTLSHRIVGLNTYAALSVEEKFIGIGFANDPCGGCHYQDIGVAFNLITRGGAIVIIALSILVFRIIRANGLVLAIILCLIPLNEKMFFYEPPIWLFLLFAATGWQRLRSARAARETAAPAAVAVGSVHAGTARGLR